MNNEDKNLLLRALSHYHEYLMKSGYYPKYGQNEIKRTEYIFEKVLKELDPNAHKQFTEDDKDVPFDDRCLTTQCIGHDPGKPCCESGGFGIGFITGKAIEVIYD